MICHTASFARFYAIAILYWSIVFSKLCFAARLAYIHTITHPYIESICIHTSSTAQGGGGSFKTRKPIGELGCCESGMAERSH